MTTDNCSTLILLAEDGICMKLNIGNITGTETVNVGTASIVQVSIQE